VTLLRAKDDYVQKWIEAVEQRTPSDIINEAGFDFTVGAPLRAVGEGIGTVAAISQDTTEEEAKKQAREIMFLLAGVETIGASKANGNLSITSTESLTISAGEAVYSTESGNKVAETLEETVFTNIETLDVKILSDEAGADISFTAGTLYLSIPNQSGTNPLIINNGTDEETDYARSQRVQEALKAKAHGTVQALITAAESVVLTDVNGIVTESVVNVLMSFPWKHEDPGTIDPVRLGEIVMSIQSSLGVPSQQLLDAIELELVGVDELDTSGKQGAGQNVLLEAVGTENIAFVVPYYKETTGVHATIEAEIQSSITKYVESLTQGQPINPTDWQAAIGGANKPEGVNYYDEANMVPATLQEIEASNIWNITSITVNEL